MKQWKCLVCGYIHIGDGPPEKCPVCIAPASKFVLLEEELETASHMSTASSKHVAQDPIVVGTGQFERLFSPITIRGMTLKNRIVMAGMGTKMMQNGFPTDQLIDYHVARTKGGTGLNLVEVSSVHTPSAPPGYGCLSEDRFIPAYRKLTTAIHDAGGKVGVFLWQGGMVISGDPSVQIITASDMPDGLGNVRKGASIALIEELIECFGQAARRAVEAGMDCVELHGAHTYIIHNFLSPALNHRTDAYGGSVENRARFPLAVIRSIRKNIPEDMPLFMRIDAHDDYLENGMTIDDVITFCGWAKEAGVDLMDVSRGNVLGNGLKYEVPSLDIPIGFNVPNAGKIKRETGLLTEAVGRINSAFVAEKVLADGHADLICMGRVQLTDPEFCNKSREGRVSEIIRCIGCNQGCFDAHMNPALKQISCVRNPAVGREREFAYTAARRSLKVGIVGGGMAGMEAAETLAKRGHRVTLWEKSDKLGGRFLDAGLAPRKQELTAAANHKGDRLMVSGADVKTGTAVSSALLDMEFWDVIIQATGSAFIPPDIEGIEKALPVIDVLRNPGLVSGKVVVIGGSRVGLEVADMLSQNGHPVTVVEQTGQLGSDLGAIRKIAVIEILAENHVDMQPSTRCTAVNDNGLMVQSAEMISRLDADTVIIAAGFVNSVNTWLKDYCDEKGISYFSIGDSSYPRDIQTAIAEGALLGRSL